MSILLLVQVLESLGKVLTINQDCKVEGFSGIEHHFDAVILCGEKRIGVIMREKPEFSDFLTACVACVDTGMPVLLLYSRAPGLKCWCTSCVRCVEAKPGPVREALAELLP